MQYLSACDLSPFRNRPPSIWYHIVGVSLGSDDKGFEPGESNAYLTTNASSNHQRSDSSQGARLGNCAQVHCTLARFAYNLTYTTIQVRQIKPGIYLQANIQPHQDRMPRTMSNIGRATLQQLFFDGFKILRSDELVVFFVKKKSASVIASSFECAPASGAEWAWTMWSKIGKMAGWMHLQAILMILAKKTPKSRGYADWLKSIFKFNLIVVEPSLVHVEQFFDSLRTHIVICSCSLVSRPSL